MYGSQYEQLQWHVKEVMLLLEGFEGEKSSDFLQELMGLAGVNHVSPGLGLSVLPLHPLGKGPFVWQGSLHPPLARTFLVK